MARTALLAVVVACALVMVPVASAAAPANPLLAGPPVSNSGSTPPGSLSGAVSVAISGNYAYTPSYYSGVLTAVDISNPAAPAVAAQSSFSNALLNASTVNIVGGIAYVVSKNANGPCLPGPSPMCGSGTNDNGTGNSLTLLDVSTNPANPTIMGTPLTDSTKLFGAYGVAVSTTLPTAAPRTYAYVAAQGCLGSPQPCPATNPPVGDSFEVVDVTDPTSPTIVAGLRNAALPPPWTGTGALKHATSVAISGHYAYVTAFNTSRLTIIDISTPTSPVIVASITNSAFNNPSDVAVSGTHAYVANQATGGPVAVVDVSTPSSPQVVGSVSNASLGGGYRIRVHGNFAYVSGSSVAAVTAIDISNPARPVVAGSLTDTAHLNKTTGLDVDSAGQYVVAASPYLSTETKPTFPPYPPASGAPTQTGTISTIKIDPVPIGVTIAPASEPPNPTTQTTANFSFSATDAVAMTRCSLDGAPFGPCSSPTTQQYTSMSLTPGPHTFTVQATDSAGTTSTDSYAWTIDQAPANTAAPTISGTASQGQILTASPGSWTGVPAPTFSYQWLRCSSTGTNCTATGAATMSPTYIVIGADVGSRLEVTVTGTGAGSSSATSARTAVVIAGTAPPVNTLRPTISGAAAIGQILTVSPGTWAGNPAPTFTYQWSDCDASGTSCSPIGAATSATYVVRSADAGFTLEATVTGTGAGSSAATSAPTSEITAIPANAAPPSISGAATQGQTLTAANGNWTGAPPPTFADQWSDCDSTGAHCSAISGATRSTYTLSAADVGHTLRVLVLATNSVGSSLATSLATAVVIPVNTPPPPAPAPTINALRQAARTWRETAKPAHAIAGRPKPKRLPTGTTFSLTLNESASVKFSFTLKTPGRKVNGRCRTQTSQNRHQKSCTIKAAAGSWVLTAHKGLDKFKFAGHLAHGKKLRPGSYTVTITATASGKRSKAKTLSFTIAP